MLTLHFALPKSHIHSDSYYPLWFQDVLPKGITPDCSEPQLMGEFGDVARNVLYGRV